MVVARVAAPEVEEGGGVQVVGDPVGEQDLVVAGATVGEDDLVFLIDELDRDAEVAAQSFLDGFGDEADGLGIVVEQLDGREALAVRMASLGEQAAGGGQIADRAGGGRVARHGRRD